MKEHIIIFVLRKGKHRILCCLIMNNICNYKNVNSEYWTKVIINESFGGGKVRAEQLSKK